MATAKKAGKKAAKKVGKKAAKKSADAKRRAPSKSTRPARKTPTPRSGGRTRDMTPPIWIPGTLEVVAGKIGVQTVDQGFISLEDVARYGQVVGLVFQPAGGEKGEALMVKLTALAEFIEEFGVSAITGIVTTCRGP
jgi:hypothetical protein